MKVSRNVPLDTRDTSQKVKAFAGPMATARKIRPLKPKKRPLGFKTEAALVRRFVKQSPASVASWRFLSTEFETGNGVVDILDVRLRKDWVRNLSLGRVAPRWAYSLKKLPYRKRFTTEDYQTLCGSTKASALKMLRNFEELGLCVRSRKSDTWRKVKQPKPVAGKVVAIEAKLSKWQSALAQAYRHQAFATQSWVLLDESRALPALANLDKFKRLNVGLLVLALSGQAKEHFVPAVRPPKSEMHVWYANSALAQSLSLEMRRVVAVRRV